MNTNTIKSFAKQARLLLLDGVAQQLKYWGFDVNGNSQHPVEKTQGGYVFRGQVFTDTSVPAKWHALNKRLTNKQAVKDVVEEVAYTWFNRLMAVKILETNGYIPPVLAYQDGVKTPTVVQNAKRGTHALAKKEETDLLHDYLQHDKDERIFGLLLTHLCNSNKVLHDVFGRIDDFTELLLPQNLLQSNGVLDLINSNAISEADYKEVELIGWLYQFYIADRKDEVFAGFKQNKKARAEDIPAATQIFTPKWIVKYMVENTVGKLYLDFEPDSAVKADLKYLVENESDQHTAPIIRNITELTLLDPACGSGHILVVGFDLLFSMYREQGYTAKQAVASILANNLFGLDIDDRAMQLARFAILLKAATYDAAILESGLQPHIYSFPEDSLASSFNEKECSVSSIYANDYLGMKLTRPLTFSYQTTRVDGKTKEEKTVTVTSTHLRAETLTEKRLELLEQHYTGSMYIDYAEELEKFWGDRPKGADYASFYYTMALLRQGKNLGSAIKPLMFDEARTHVLAQFATWQKRQEAGLLDIYEAGLWQNLKPFLEVLLLLTNTYTAVVANPPYMGSGNMNAALIEYLQAIYSEYSNDFMIVFMKVGASMLRANGYWSMINIHSWLTKKDFKGIREFLTNEQSIESLIHMGRGVFGSDFGTVAFSVKNQKSNSETITISRRLFDSFVKVEPPQIKEAKFLDENYKSYRVSQSNFRKLPGYQIAYWLNSKVFATIENSNIKNFGDAKQGIKTGDNSLFIRNWHEVSLSHTALKKKTPRWFPLEKGGDFRKWFGNNYYVLDWEDDGYRIRNFRDERGKLKSRPQNIQYFFTEGITWSTSASYKPSFRLSSKIFAFESSGSKFFIKDNFNEADVMLGFLNSNVGEFLLEVFSLGKGITEGAIKALPYIENDNNSSIKKCVIENIQIAQNDWDSRETSWDFSGSPLLNQSATLPQAYQTWQAQVTQDFFRLHANEEELNRIFIEIYGLQEELTPEVALKDITILQEELDGKSLEALEPTFRAQGAAAVALPIKKEEVVAQFLSYCMGIFMGRYRLDVPGLNIAHPNPTEAELAAYTYNGHRIAIDEDGVIPLMGENCTFPDDVLNRIKHLIEAIWGEAALTENINFVHECLSTNLHKWLTEKFWGYHTSMYKKKPIYWLFSSNPKKPQQAAFNVLVYMHRMDKYTVQKIQRNYLYPHQEHIKTEIERLATNEGNLNREEQKRLEQLYNGQIECRDYNEVLKQLANQQIEFDLDDGVDVNYAKFERAVAKI